MALGRRTAACPRPRGLRRRPDRSVSTVGRITRHASSGTSVTNRRIPAHTSGPIAAMISAAVFWMRTSEPASVVASPR